MLEVKDLSKDHPVVKAAYRMVEAHQWNETLLPAIEQLSDEFPEIEPEILIALWLGINAKERSS